MEKALSYTKKCNFVENSTIKNQINMSMGFNVY